MSNERNQFSFYLLSFYSQCIKMVGFVFFAWFTLQATPYHQDLAYADSEGGNVISIDNDNLQRSNEQAFSIMQQQLSAYKERLQESERNLEAFQQEHGIILLDSQINLLLQQRKTLDSSLKTARNVTMGFKEKLAWVKDQIKEVPRDIALSKTSREQGVIGGAKSNLLGLQLKEQQLLTKYTKSSPHLRAIHEEMAVIARFIKEQEAKEAESVSSGKNPIYAEMEMQLFRTQAELVSAEAQSTVIREQIKGVDQELERFRGLKPGLDDLLRQVKSDETNYLNYLTKVGTTPQQDYQIQVGDQLDIKFFFNPELNEAILVRPDGRIALQLVGEIPVVGHTVEQIREILIKNYAGQLKNPEIAVLLRSSHVLPGAMGGAQTGLAGKGGGNGN